MKKNLDSMVREARDITIDAKNFERSTRDFINTIRKLDAASPGGFKGVLRKLRKERKIQKIENRVKEKNRSQNPLPSIDKRICLDYAHMASRRASTLYVLANNIYNEMPELFAKLFANDLRESARKWEKAGEMWQEIADTYFS